MPQKRFTPETVVAVNTGVQYEPFNLDIGRWHGRIVGQVENGDYLVRWDKPTIEAMPGWAVASWIESGEDWSCMEMEPEILQRSRARDGADDWFDALCQRLQEQGITPNFLAAPDFMGEGFGDEEGLPYSERLTAVDFDDFDNDFDDDFDDFEEDFEEEADFLDEYDYFDEDDLDWEPFIIEEFVTMLQIPPDQHTSLFEALEQAMADYYDENFAVHTLTTEAFIYKKLGSPYIFGYAAVAILNHPRLSCLTKIKVCQYLLDQIDPTDREGIPHGLINMLAFLAREQLLVIPVFALLLFTLDYTRRGLMTPHNWLETLHDKSEMVDLLTWLLQQKEIEEKELLWWFWRFSLMCYRVHHSWGSALSNLWLKTDKVSAEIKTHLYYAWLEHWPIVGQPPLVWQMTDAQAKGDIESLLALYEQSGIMPSVEDIAFLKEQAAEIKAMAEEFALPLGRLHDTTYLLPSFKRLSVVGLAQLGIPLERLLIDYWDMRDDTDTIHQGLAEALAKHHEQLNPKQLRSYIERGLNHGSAKTRRPFFTLSIKLFGNEYIDQALKDEAKSIRDWAAKQT